MATNQFRGIPYENRRGANLCFCNAGTNALLSSGKITSTIRQRHCYYCDFLYGMKNVAPYPLVKSTRPLKVFVAQLKPSFRTNRQQDADEFVQCLLNKCETLKELTQCVVMVAYKCKGCGKEIRSEDRRNILYENLTGSSIADIISTEKTLLFSLKGICKERTRTPVLEDMLGWCWKIFHPTRNLLSV